MRRYWSFAGVKGASEHWFDNTMGMRKRYGKLVTVGETSPTMYGPYHEFSFIRRGDIGHAPTEDPANNALFFLEGFEPAKGGGQAVKKRATKRAGDPSRKAGLSLKQQPRAPAEPEQRPPPLGVLSGAPQLAAAAAAQPTRATRTAGPPGAPGPISVGQSRAGRQRRPTARAAAAAARSQRSASHTHQAAASSSSGEETAAGGAAAGAEAGAAGAGAGAGAARGKGVVGGDVLVAPLEIRTSHPEDKRFISFRSPGPSGDGSFELGAIVRARQGVKLQSNQGDFAEWHRRRAGEPPFLEGEVVGFDSQGRLSRRTAGARMLGVISRSAVVEGSAPPQGDRASYDTVAYAGVVPVRTVRGQEGGRKRATAACETSPCVSSMLGVRAGDVLIPSGRNDGLAVVVPAASGGSKQWSTISRVATILQSDETPWGNQRGAVRMVSAVVIPPTETVQRRPAQKLMWCALTGLVIIISIIVFVETVIWGRLSTLNGDDSASIGLSTDHGFTFPLCTEADVSNCSCNPGYFGGSGKGCTRCPRSSWSAVGRDAIAPTACTACPANASGLVSGMTSAYNCGCDAGYSANLSTTEACTPCPVNTWAAGFYLLHQTDIPACITCPAHSSTSGRTAQDLPGCTCDSGYYGNEVRWSYHNHEHFEIGGDTSGAAAVNCSVGTSCCVGFECCTKCPADAARITNHNMRDAVTECLEQAPGDGVCPRSPYGSISCWDVSNVTSFSEIFSVHRVPKAEFFNGDLSGWETKQVVDMSGAFVGCTALTERSGVSAWNTSGLHHADYIFEDCKNFDADLGSWDVSGVRSFYSAFRRATAFTGKGLDRWDVRSLENAGVMFGGASLFNGAISKWRTPRLSQMVGIFQDAAEFNQDLDKWDVSGVIGEWDGSDSGDGNGMWSAFEGATKFNGDISTWQVGHIQRFSSMFYKASSFNG
jgi:hypothetical protein